MLSKKVLLQGSLCSSTFFNTIERGSMTLLDDLQKEGVRADLLARVKAFQNRYPLEKEEAIRVRRPPFFYMGRRVWEQAISALLAGENLLLTGPKATGKNVLAENLAYLFQRPAWTVNFHINTDASTLIGTDTFQNGQVQYRRGPILEAALHGGFAILDEINMARNDAVAVLHAALDYRRSIDLPGYDRFDLREETRFIATMNYGYIGTRELNEALASRFLILQMPPITEEALVRLLQSQEADLTDEWAVQLAGLFHDLQLKSDQAELSSKPVDLRGLLAAIQLIRQGLPPHQALEMGLVNKSFDPFEQDLVRDCIALRIPQKISPQTLFKQEYSDQDAAPSNPPAGEEARLD